MSSSSQKLKSVTRYKSIVNKLLNNNKINESLLTFIDSISLEDLIALKLELSARHINNRMYGFNIWHGTNYIVKEAILRFSVGATKSKKDAARFLGISYIELIQLLKKYELMEYFQNERAF
jgi:methionyl-tRNA formyltransferase